MGLFGLFGQDSQEIEQKAAEKEIVNHVRSKVEQCRAAASRVAHEGIWMTNIAYLLGYDGVSFNSTTRQFQPINRAAAYLKKNRLHVNKILPTIQNRLARLCKNPPKYDVRPESNDTDDKEAARLALQVLSSLWDKLRLDEKRIPLYMWVSQCGHAYVKVCWDPSDGKPMVDPETNEFSHEGEVRADIVSPFEIFPDPMARSFEDALRSWVIQAKVRTLDYFKIHYPEKGEEVKPEEVWLMSAQYEQRINSLNSRGPSQGGMQDQMKNCAIELIKYEAPSKNHPNGRMIIIANGVLLEDKDLPEGEIPFAKFDDIVIGGKYYSESTITHLRPIQDQFNETIRRRAEWTRKLLAGKYKAARGSGIQQEAMNDDNGEVVYFDPVPTSPNGPEAMQIPMIPQWAYNEEDRLDKMFTDISGISEVSKGQMPSASIPAIGMQLLTEQDDTRIGVMTEQHEHAWSRVGMLMLKCAEANWQMPRKLKVAGKALEYTVKEVTGEMIRGNTDVMVIRGSTLPGSKTLKRQEILNTYQQGLLGDPADPKVREKVLSSLEFGDIAELWQDQGLDQAQIKRVIESLERGESVDISEFDNHAAWLQEMNRYRKGDKFKNLDPTVQQLFIGTMEALLSMNMQVNNQMPPPTSPMEQAQMSGEMPMTDPNQPQPMPGQGPAGGPAL